MKDWLSIIVVSCALWLKTTCIIRNCSPMCMPLLTWRNTKILLSVHLRTKFANFFSKCLILTASRRSSFLKITTWATFLISLLLFMTYLLFTFVSTRKHPKLFIDFGLLVKDFGNIGKIWYVEAAKGMHWAS